MRAWLSAGRPKGLRYIALVAVAAFAQIPHAQTSRSPFDDLHFCGIGPAATGRRIHDIQIDHKNPAVLYAGAATGATDLTMDPRDPNVLYAATYQRLRKAFGFNGGGPGSGIYKTIDGGANWRKLENGIPVGDKGRIGLAIAQSKPDVLVATIEHA